MHGFFEFLGFFDGFYGFSVTFYGFSMASMGFLWRLEDLCWVRFFRLPFEGSLWEGLSLWVDDSVDDSEVVEEEEDGDDEVAMSQARCFCFW